MADSNDPVVNDEWWSLGRGALVLSLRSRAESLTTAEAAEASRRDAGANIGPGQRMRRFG